MGTPSQPSVVGGSNQLFSSNLLQYHSKKMAAKSFYEMSAKALSGEMVSFSKYRGKVVLIQNTATL